MVDVDRTVVLGNTKDSNSGEDEGDDEGDDHEEIEGENGDLKYEEGMDEDINEE